MTYKELDANPSQKKQEFTEFNWYEICFGFIVAIVFSYSAYSYNSLWILPAFVVGAAIGMNFAYYIMKNVFKKHLQK